ncbi:flagellar hook-length control protein FliK [Aquincola sp. MAHUQ-54]|uniref:Flagellar hook-length control protein FliK n=1 Tax=Aquincola agrisoli TaxID=3119538 RepID=A0AAW9Q6I4_9BURK
MNTFAPTLPLDTAAAAAATAAPARVAPATGGLPRDTAQAGAAAAAPGEASAPTAFNALLASLGLLPPAASGELEAGEADAADADPQAGTTPDAHETAGLAAPDVLAAAPPVPPLPPALTPDAATLLVSLPAPVSMAAPAPQDALPVDHAELPLAATAATPAAQAPAAPRAAPATPFGDVAKATPPTTAAPATATRAELPPAAGVAALREAKPATGAAIADATARSGAREEAVAAPAATAAAAAMPATSAGESTSAVQKASATAVPAESQPLLQALGDRVRVQIAQRSEHAVIRLDPPMMGSVEIVLRHEAGALHVQLTASNPDVQRQLQHISDALRQDLSQRQYTDVSVNVAAQPGDADGRRRQGHGSEPEERPGQALAEAERGAAPGGFTLASILE